MANFPTNEYWEFDGISLQQYGWNITTLGGSRLSLPQRRGENSQFAFLPGALHRTKVPDQRILALNMWTTGTNPATGVPSADQILQWNDNWDTLKRLLWSAGGGQKTLTRRQYLTISGSPTVLVTTSEAELYNTVDLTMTGRTRAEFTVEFLLNDPYFYGSEVETQCDLTVAEVINNPGYDYAFHNNFEVDLVGPLTDPLLTNATPTPDIWVKYTGSISGGQTVRLDVPTFRAYRISDSLNVIDKISHSGFDFWMNLAKGNNSLTLTASAGTGHAIVRYKPPYA